MLHISIQTYQYKLTMEMIIKRYHFATCLPLAAWVLFTGQTYKSYDFPKYLSPSTNLIKVSILGNCSRFKLGCFRKDIGSRGHLQVGLTELILPNKQSLQHLFITLFPHRKIKFLNLHS